MQLEDLEVYQLSMELGEKIWEITIRWNYFAKDTVGRQLVRAADSIGANLAEGFGRFSYKENRQFCFYARGSLYETRTWLTKGNRRKLINDDDFIVFNTPSACGGVIPLKSGPGLALGVNTLYWKKKQH